MTHQRYWVRLPAQHHRSPKIVELLERHGPSGPLSFLVLLSEAAMTATSEEADRGVAAMSWREFGRYAGIPLEETTERLQELAVDPFELIEIEKSTALGFRARFLRWAEWDGVPKDPLAAARAKAYRARKRDGA